MDSLTVQDCDTKHAELEKGKAEGKKRYQQLCKQIGITGDNVRKSPSMNVIKLSSC